MVGQSNLSVGTCFLLRASCFLLPACFLPLLLGESLEGIPFQTLSKTGAARRKRTRQTGPCPSSSQSIKRGHSSQERRSHRCSSSLRSFPRLALVFRSLFRLSATDPSIVPQTSNTRSASSLAGGPSSVNRLPSPWPPSCAHPGSSNQGLASGSFKEQPACLRAGNWLLQICKSRHDSHGRCACFMQDGLHGT